MKSSNSFINMLSNLKNDTPNGEKRRLFYDCAKLGFVLFMYNVFMKIFTRVFYFAAYSVLSKKFTLSFETVAIYLNKRKSLLGSTSFTMSANISIIGMATIATALLLCALKINIFSWLTPSANGVKVGGKWLAPCFVFNMISSMLISYLTSFLSSNGVTLPESDFSIAKPTIAAVVLQFLYVIVLAPLFEEFVYRGVILGTLSPYSKTAAIIVSALSFGLMHGNVPQAISAFITGIIYAIIAVNCKSIVPTIIIHSFNNVMANFSTLAGAIGIKNYDVGFSIFQVVTAFAGFFVLFVYIKDLSYKEDEHEVGGKEMINRTLLNPVLILYFLMLIINIVSGIVSANA